MDLLNKVVYYEWKLDWVFEKLQRPKTRRPTVSLSLCSGMEAFSSLIDKAVVGGSLSGYTLKGRNGASVSLSHLLFADDTLVLL